MPPVGVVRQRDLLSFLAKLVFGVSVILALGAVGYKVYLDYSIKEMGAELERTRAELATGEVDEIIRLNDRIVSAEELIENHRMLTPLFAFLEVSTPKSVRFGEFTFIAGTNGPELVIRGDTRSYAALALEAYMISKNKDFHDPVFSDIRLDERGNVTFSLKTGLSPELLSYEREMKKVGVPPSAPAGQLATSTPVSRATSTATTTASRATSTVSGQATSTRN